MDKILLDSNIWNVLADDEAARARIVGLVAAGSMRVLVPDTLDREMQNSPWKGIPDWFPTEKVSDAPFVLGHSRLGRARFGSEATYSRHKGQSRKISDAVLASVASMDGAILVTEDRRAQRRFADIAGESRSIDYRRFRTHILELSPDST
jgi:hypothetical protein